LHCGGHRFEPDTLHAPEYYVRHLGRNGLVDTMMDARSRASARERVRLVPSHQLRVRLFGLDDDVPPPFPDSACGSVDRDGRSAAGVGLPCTAG
jgi:hypothetical protein